MGAENLDAKKDKMPYCFFCLKSWEGENNNCAINIVYGTLNLSIEYNLINQMILAYCE